jgi:cellulose biosynthesis protein BcsQ
MSVNLNMCKKIGIFSIAKKCGKSTSAAFLAESFTTLGHNTLLIDADPVSELKKKLTVKDKLGGGLMKVKMYNSPSTWTYLQQTSSYSDVKELIVKYKFDYVIYDLSVVENQNAMEQLDTLIIPIEAEFYGLDLTKSNLSIIKKYPNLKTKILITKLNENGKNSMLVKEYLRTELSSLVFNSVISRNYYLGLDHFSVENLNKTIPNFGFADYLKLANEIKEQEQNG